MRSSIAGVMMSSGAPRAINRPGVQQGKPLALAGRQVGGGEEAIAQRHLVGDVQPLQVALRIRRQSGAGSADLVEQVIVGEDGGEELAVIVACRLRGRLPVEPDDARLRRGEPVQSNQTVKLPR